MPCLRLDQRREIGDGSKGASRHVFRVRTGLTGLRYPLVCLDKLDNQAGRGQIALTELA